MTENNSSSFDDEFIAEQYKKYSVETPDSSVDRVIYAASHRELKKESIKITQLPRKQSFWDRLRLPVAMSAAFVMTFTLAHVIWPIVQFENEIMGTAAFDSDMHHNQAEAKSISELASDTVKLASEIADVGILKAQRQVKSEEAGTVPASEKLAIVDSSQAQQKIIKSAKVWSEEIIALAEQGNFEEVQKQLEAFEKEYPDYPIKDLLQSYIQ
ncbi:hypothetical protein [Pleionea sp. CnH1-48]|uniref:hypothetical protein n=1 Tax=Pleionea sp. CnH1-48 TaxID=2954494 RepID=UPI0020981598|nr:hypothetical protein [Pleionea sp. CnH1-48]MCO7224642.1 hypothetical protein [Pleionea sp. CnH1-48]